MWRTLFVPPFSRHTAWLSVLVVHIQLRGSMRREDGFDSTTCDATDKIQGTWGARRDDEGRTEMHG